MKYQLLTETKFFKLLETAGNADCTKLQAEYHAFIGHVIELSQQAHVQQEALLSLVFAETELQYHPLLRSEAECGLGLYAKKALSFIRKMMQQVKSGISNMLSAPAATNAIGKKKDNGTSPIRWTGKASDLVEILYGIDELGCINDGETPLKEIAAYFYKMLGVNAKECYHIYADMKMRKNESRTYFLDKMQERVNRRMDLDEERERMRR